MYYHLFHMTRYLHTEDRRYIENRLCIPADFQNSSLVDLTGFPARQYTFHNRPFLWQVVHLLVLFQQLPVLLKGYNKYHHIRQLFSYCWNMK